MSLKTVSVVYVIAWITFICKYLPHKINLIAWGVYLCCYLVHFIIENCALFITKRSQTAPAAKVPETDVTKPVNDSHLETIICCLCAFLMSNDMKVSAAGFMGTHYGNLEGSIKLNKHVIKLCNHRWKTKTNPGLWIKMWYHFQLTKIFSKVSRSNFPVAVKTFRSSGQRRMKLKFISYMRK